MTSFHTPRAGERMLEVEEAQQLVLDEVRELETEEVSFADSLGRVVREDVVSPFDSPAADNSAMDGYAVRAADVADARDDRPALLDVVGDVPAGSVPQCRVEPGTAVRIMTGAYVPEGADAIVKVELTDAGAEKVRVFKAVKRGTSVRRRGEDLREGAVVLRSGTVAGPSEIALLASIRKTTLRVGRRPKVAILSTGDELTGVDAAPAAGKIVNSNGYALSALVHQAGGVPWNLGIVRDTREATREAFAAAASADFIVSSGGVSVGAYDFVKDALDDLGAVTKFWRVAMKPGKPVVLSRLGEAVCFGLPGNPVSCVVGFHLFVAPAIRKALGVGSNRFPPQVTARLTAPLKAAEDRRIYFRGRVVSRGGKLFAEPLAAQGSGSLSSILGANALLMVGRGQSVAAGEKVTALLIGQIEGE